MKLTIIGTTMWGETVKIIDRGKQGVIDSEDIVQIDSATKSTRIQIDSATARAALNRVGIHAREFKGLTLFPMQQYVEARRRAEEAADQADLTEMIRHLKSAEEWSRWGGFSLDVGWVASVEERLQSAIHYYYDVPDTSLCPDRRPAWLTTAKRTYGEGRPSAIREEEREMCMEDSLQEAAYHASKGFLSDTLNNLENARLFSSNEFPFDEDRAERILRSCLQNPSAL